MFFVSTGFCLKRLLPQVARGEFVSTGFLSQVALVSTGLLSQVGLCLKWPSLSQQAFCLKRPFVSSGFLSQVGPYHQATARPGEGKLLRDIFADPSLSKAHVGRHDCGGKLSPSRERQARSIAFVERRPRP